jgi:hypothetical protein
VIFYVLCKFAKSLKLLFEPYTCGLYFNSAIFEKISDSTLELILAHACLTPYDLWVGFIVKW